MKREFKFRVWDKVDYMSKPFTFQDLMYGKVEFTGDCPIMQFTGLEDKNGNEIYEGDLVRVYGVDIREVKFEHAFWWMKEVDMVAGNVIGGFGTPQDNKYKPHKPLYRYGDIEVVGNIYQTPELLNQNTTA